jgi:hypothetical protein
MRECAEREMLWLRFLPERTGLADFLEYCEHVGSIVESFGEIIRVRALPEIIDGKKLERVSQGHDAVVCGRIKMSIVPNVLFRPEEVHGASGIAEVLVPPPERNSHISHNGIRLDYPEMAILNFQMNGQTAI